MYSINQKTKLFIKPNGSLIISFNDNNFPITPPTYTKNILILNNSNLELHELNPPNQTPPFKSHIFFQTYSYSPLKSKLTLDQAKIFIKHKDKLIYSTITNTNPEYITSPNYTIPYNQSLNTQQTLLSKNHKFLLHLQYNNKLYLINTETNQPINNEQTKLLHSNENLGKGSLINKNYLFYQPTDGTNILIDTKDTLKGLQDIYITNTSKIEFTVSLHIPYNPSTFTIYDLTYNPTNSKLFRKTNDNITILSDNKYIPYIFYTDNTIYSISRKEYVTYKPPNTNTIYDNPSDTYVNNIKDNIPYNIETFNYTPI